MKTLLALTMIAGTCAAATPKATVNAVTVDASAAKVTVSYALSDAAAIVTAKFFTNGVAVAEGDATSLFGDVNKLVAVGDTRSFAWYVRHDIPDFPACDVSVELSLWSEANPPDYMAVSLQAPSNVLYYASTNALPGGIGSDRWRTGELLMRRIRAKGATFPMGKNTPDAKRIKEHAVTLTNDFYIGVFELTQSQLYNISGKNAYYRDGKWEWTQSNKFTNLTCNATRPADNLLWRTLKGTKDGMATAAGGIIGKLNAKTGLPFDLPTEAQWEFACRAGTETQRFDSDLNRVSRNKDNGGMNGGALWPYDVAADKATARVGSYAPNAYGLYDMYGNVNEICLDRYEALTDGKAVTEPLITSGGQHVARGGNAASTDLKWLTSAMRMGPFIESMDNPGGGDLYGARLAIRIRAAE